MFLDIPKTTRSCSITKREFATGESYFSAIYDKDGDTLRLDFATDVWTSLTDSTKEQIHEKYGTCIGWWKCQVPTEEDKKTKLAPNDVLLNLFDTLANIPEKREMRYVLTLLLVRRRLFRIEKEETVATNTATNTVTGTGENGDGGTAEERELTVYCPKRDLLYHLPVAVPPPDVEQQIQDTLVKLLYIG